MAFMHRFVRQHGLTHHIANGEDVRHIGAHLLVHVDKAALGHVHTGFVCSNFFAIRGTTYGLQHQVVQLRRRSALSFKRHFNAFGHGTC